MAYLFQKDRTLIETSYPLELRNEQLSIDTLALHLIREPNGATLICMQPPNNPYVNRELPSERPGKYLHKLLLLAGTGVYWGNIFHTNRDPIFACIIALWYPLYAWDEAMEALHNHIRFLESRVIKFDTNDVALTSQLHVIRVYLQRYDEMLDQFEKSVRFLMEVGISELYAASHENGYLSKNDSKAVLKRETDGLLAQVARLQRQRKMDDARLSNVMTLVFSIVNINETHYSLRHAEANNLIAYLGVFFLPATIITGVFGMNVREINDGTHATLWMYFTVTIPFTLFVVWVVRSMMLRHRDPTKSIWACALWPVDMLNALVGRRHAVVDLEKGMHRKVE